MCACEFEVFIDKDDSVIYRNIKKLEEAGLVNTFKDGRKLFAEVSDKDAVSNLVGAVEALEPDLPDIAIEDLQEA